MPRRLLGQKTNSRGDTDYWRANADNQAGLSDSLRQIYSMWMAGDKNLTSEIGKQNIGKGYPIISWFCILAGMGLFPGRDQLRPMRGSGQSTNMAQIDTLMQRSALNFRDQREVLKDIPEKNPNLLQIYLW